MRQRLKNILCFTILGIAFISCQNENQNVIVNPSALMQSSPLTTKLIALTYTDDTIEVTDDMIDDASCFKIKFPYSVSVNGEFLFISSEADYELVTQILNASGPGKATISLAFPITVIFATQPTNQEVTITSQQEFDVIQNDCNYPNTNSPCISLVYPITIFGYNSEFQIQNNYTINSNDQLFQFLTNIGVDSYQLSYPIEGIFGNGNNVTIESNEAFVDIIDEAAANCLYAPSACKAYVLNDDLILYLPFANQVKDLTGLGNASLGNQNFHFVTDRSGHSNAAISFDSGSESNTINTTLNSNNNLIQNGAFTISFWFNRQNVQPSTIEQLYNANAITIGLGPNSNTPQIRSPYLAATGLSAPMVDPEWTQSLEGEINIWHHIVVTYDGELLKFYRDGVLRSASANAQFEGIMGGGTFGNGYVGFLDDVRIYKRALRFAEVQLLNNLPGENNQCLD